MVHCNFFISLRSSQFKIMKLLLASFSTRNSNLRNSIGQKCNARIRFITGRAKSTTEHNRVNVSVDSAGIAHVQLNRPEKLNALDMNMFEAIAKTAQELRTDQRIRAVILSGQGRAFCTGLDVKSLVKHDPNGSIERLLERPNNQISNLAQDVAYQWRRVPVPVIAVLHGMCYGGGLQIALGADFRFTTPDCQLSILESKWGLIPDMSMTVTLRELVRIDVAKELTMTGKILSGKEAAAIGLVTRCVDDPHAEAKALADAIVGKSPDAVALTKELYQRTWVNASEESALLLETKLQRKLLKSWNQLAASGRAFGVGVPYLNRQESSSSTDIKT